MSRQRLIDTDVHERVELEQLLPHLPAIWHKYVTDYGWTPERFNPYSQPTAGGLARADAVPEGGGLAGSSLPLLREQLLDEYGIEQAILTGWLSASALQEGWSEFKTALMSAYNDHQVAHWLDREERLYGSVQVNAWDPEGAAREIERMAAHPKIVQVMLYVGDQAYGSPRYHPIFAAAERHGLVVGIHHSENSTPALGRHRYYAEWHTLISQVFMSQAVSLIFNGVFEKFPALKVILIEGGFSYVPHLMWRSDQQWRELRHEVPWVKRAPSRIIREQVRFASQPIEELTTPQLLSLIDQMGSEELICLSSDYPHWDFDSPFEALPPGFPEDLKQKIFWENALATYARLPAVVGEAGTRVPA
ncbi:MAG TPA: amidohydrolase family protein [Solirubrobacterales bacterium]|nr:amidohydrolase family protein [Solirubrobacterales bacterium]